MFSSPVRIDYAVIQKLPDVHFYIDQ